MGFRIFFPALLLCSSLTRAQLCNNNLGDPIINITFGNKYNLQFPKTTYDFVGGCPSKGQYTINNFLFGCGGNWTGTIGDHTHDQDGNYMLIDAESTPGIVHLDTATNLCSNMTYQYSAYIANVMLDRLTCDGHAVLPALTFSIEKFDGTVLATYNTGDIPITNDRIWKQYGLTFKTPADVNAVILRLSESSPMGCGSAFVVDDIAFQNCGPVVNVTIDGTTDKQNVCADYANPFIMQGTYSAGFANPVVQWQNSLDTGKTWKDIPGQTTTSYTVPHRVSGVILYRMVVAEKENINSANCRIRSNSIYTEIHPLPEHKQPQYLSGCTGKDYSLPAGDDHAIEFLWTGPDAYTSTDRSAVIADLQSANTGLYKLKQTFDFSCTDFDSFYLKTSPGITLAVGPLHPICEGESETLTVTPSGDGTFEWTPLTGLSSTTISSPVAMPQDSTIYKVVATNSYGCQDSALLPVDVYKKPVANAGEDKIILQGDSGILNGQAKGTAINYYWSPSLYIDNVNAIQPKVYPPQEMNYTLNVVSTVGCGSASDDVNVQIYKGFFIPNSFTPNGDGKNDKFRILAYNNYKIERFIIYNRWGAVIFKTNNAGDGWDGTYKNLPQPIGSYVYYLELSDANNKKIIRQGTVSLLR